MTDKPNNDQPSDLTLASRRSFLKHSIIAASGVALFGGMSLGMRSAAWAAGGDVETSKAKLGFIALTDAAPLFVAAEKGFFAKYGMTEVEVLKQSSWGTTRDNLVLGSAKNGIDGAHILTPMPYLISAGIVTPNNQPVPMSILARLNLAGQCISVGEEYRDLKIGLDSTPFKAALEAKEQPKALALSRQNLPVLEGTKEKAFEGVARGAYVLIDATDADGAPTPARALLIATGSEVSVAVRARALLQADGVPTRVVSAPCLEWFAEQDEAYRAEVLPDGPDAPVRVSVEAGIAMPWFEHTVTASSPGARVSLEHYGESADGARLMEKYGFTGEHVAEVTRGLL